MFKPEDPFSPRDNVFEEAWHAQTLAMADAMVKAGHISAQQWALALGANLGEAEQNGAPDTTETYYTAALNALETLTALHTPIGHIDMANRKVEWENAYQRTPHGQPVVLKEREA